MKSVHWRPEALGDVARALKFGQTRWPRKAAHLAAHLIASVERLRLFPHSGREGEGTARELVVSGYPLIIVYEPADEAVFVLRVIHQRQKWPVE